jgi:hypothetical protein
MEVHFAIGEDFISALQTRLGATSTIEVVREALALLDWASKERALGRFVLSTDENGCEIHRLVMPSLDQVMPA